MIKRKSIKEVAENFCKEHQDRNDKIVYKVDRQDLLRREFSRPMKPEEAESC
jgi:hypothetical protein